MEAAAYFFTQDSPGAKPTLDQCVFTIDSIETRTGLDFFASLPDEYESETEARHSTLTAQDALVRANRAPPRQPRAPPSRAANDARNSGPSQGDVIVYVTKSGTKYHLGHCQYLRKSRTPTSLDKARPQYSQCSVCRPHTLAPAQLKCLDRSSRTQGGTTAARRPANRYLERIHPTRSVYPACR